MRVLMIEVYRDWINALKDRASRARIQVRVDRLAHGGDKSTQQQDIKAAIALARNL